MHSFSEQYLKKITITPEILRLIGQIREYKGKQQLYAERKPEVLESMRQVAFIESVESSNRLERIETSRKVLKQIVEHKENPTRRPQTELAGYRDVLETIHQNHKAISFTPSFVLQLHRDMLAYTHDQGGSFKSSPNDIVEKNEKGEIVTIRFRTVPPHLTSMSMDRLHQGFLSAQSEHDSLLLIPNYVHDFLCIHPFPDGNGRMARLLTVLLLYKHGFDVGRYVSIEKLIESSKESYYESLALSDYRWHEGQHDHVPFTSYMLGVILAAYKRLDADLGKIETGRGYKTELVKQAIDALPDQFAISDIEKRCPSVSRDTIRNVLQALSKDGCIRSVGKGRSAYWQKNRGRYSEKGE
jgi:Fic family protein